MNAKTYEFDARIDKEEKHSGAYIKIPFDARAEFGKGRVPVHATFDNEPYDGSVVNMGVKHPDGSICYILGIRKDIREKIGKQPGDVVRVTLQERAATVKSETSVDAYIEGVDPERQEVLKNIRAIITKAAPNAQERTSWGMPTYWQGENLVHFANAKSHVGFYPGVEAMEAFSQKLAPYKTSKGAVQFLYKTPMPYEIIDEITRWRVAQVQEKQPKEKE